MVLTWAGQGLRSEAILRDRYAFCSSSRCASADEAIEWFEYPDGSEWNLPKAWGIGKLRHVRPSFRTSAYRSFELGSPELVVPVGWVVEDVPLKFIEKPRRSAGEWLVDKKRLLSVLNAMLEGVALLPVQADEHSTDWGPLRVANGFHRYYASLILGYADLPIVRPKRRNFVVPEPDTCQAEMQTMLANKDGCAEPSLQILERHTALQRRETAAMTERAATRRRKPPELRSRWEPVARRRERHEKARREELRRQWALDMQHSLADKAFRKALLARRACERLSSPVVGARWADVAKRPFLH
eukprot:TRINITY_DN72993_c0_g1_i1.p1 TRINITY_DN72993_c0_g1~~TRINITY_DN72993_c0_g1_i1.p1  ORF type:complete len:300 (-),score=31.70 TRINITY_DN72993_c0_g1_i1:131-1030(-)